MNALTVFDHLYVVVLVVVVLFAVFRGQPKMAGARLDSRDRVAIYWSNSIFLYMIALLALLIWWFQGRAWADLGLAWPAGQSTTAVVALTGIFLILLVAESVRRLYPRERLLETSRNWRQRTPFMPTRRSEVWHGLHLSVCAGVTEEIVFRGYLINYFARLFSGNNLWEIPESLFGWSVILAILLPGLLFAFAHLYSGWSAVFQIVGLAAVFGAIFVLSRSLLVVVILHILIDVVAVLLSPWIMRQTEDAAVGELATPPT